MKILKWAVFLCLAFSYWYLGNNQIFDNILFVMEYSSETVHSGHTVISDLKDLQYDGSFTPLLFAIIFLVSYPILPTLLGMLKLSRSFEVDENLGNYY